MITSKSTIFLFLTLLQLYLVVEAFHIPNHQDINIKSCGYESCPIVQPDKLNIHLIAHTHDDVGWLKTVDQYYFGSRTRIQVAGVQYILDSVIKALLNHPDRRFIYVETAFFWKWWLRQNEQVKEDVKTLINEGRLEIIGGAWSMNDEAVTHYHSIVDQFTWGFRRLNDTFGSCARPRIGWQIDPFGHSREQASLFAQMGFDGMLFGRIDYQDKAQRIKDKTMEFVWEASSSLGSSSHLFTTAMFNTYSPPPGFCFDILCVDDPVIDDPDSPDYNIDVKIFSFLEYAKVQATHYNTNNVIVTMGGDFTYQQAEMYYMNMDKLIRYGNEQNGSTVNLFYSTPSCYLKAVNDANLLWSVKTDDFFPYASDPHAYWTGYFSSRPTIKFFERMGNNLLQISKQLSVLTDTKKYEKYLEHFREAMGVMQHHDAVTGTEKQLVADDYARILYESMQYGEKITAESIRKWAMNGKQEDPLFEYYSCMKLNISSCIYTEDNDNFFLSVYNPLSRPISTYIRLPVQGNSYDVFNISGEKLVTQVIPIPSPVLQIPGRISKATNELVFHAVDLPSLGYKTFKIIRNVDTTKETEKRTESVTSISNNGFTVSVDENGHVIVEYDTREHMNFVQSFEYYEGAEGNNKVFENRSSGAYIFRPRTTSSKNLAYTGHYEIIKGPLVQEIHQTINKWISQVIRIYKNEDNIEFDWLIGPIPVEDKIGKEIVTKYSSNLKSEGEFYTDSNGREMLKRKRNQRLTWPLRLHEPVAGNYYPVTTKISLKDQQKPLKLNILTDRAQGGTSLQDGELELMLHRRLLKDDAFGVGEALNESAFGEGLVVRGTHFVFGGSVKNLDSFILKEKELALQLALRPWILITPLSEKLVEKWENTYIPQKSGLNKILPPNIHILTLEPWKKNTILLRLEHIFEVGEATKMSQPTEINIQDLFSTFTIVFIKETTLGGNQWLKDMNRLKWEIETNDILHKEETVLEPVQIRENAINVLLKPMEIRTFIIEILPRNVVDNF